MIANSSVVLAGNNIFKDKKALSGGAIFVADSTLIFRSTTRFIMNMTRLCDNADAKWQEEASSWSSLGSFFINNTARFRGGAVFVSKGNRIIGSALFYNGSKGRALIFGNTTVQFEGCVSFWNNGARDGGALYITKSYIVYMCYK